MSEATLIYPHQLFANHPGTAPGRPIYLVEEPLLLTHNPIHRGRALLHRLSMQAYARQLQAAGHTVHYLDIGELATTTAVFDQLTKAGHSRVHVVDTTDDYLERSLAAAEETHGFTRVSYESPLFILPRAEAKERYQKSQRRMSTFYHGMRKRQAILLTPEGKPVGGQWSFDTENRASLPQEITLPPDLKHYGNPDTREAKVWVEALSAECYGDAVCWLPYTHEGAKRYLNEFLTERLENFGTYEDAIDDVHARLFHSALSPLLNIGLLIPEQIIETTLSHAARHAVPHNSLEGFVRQVIGWREFIRASYEVDGKQMRVRNFWQNTKSLPVGMWDGTTTLPPLDAAITRALTHGYTHHIERLMVIGNYLLLTETDPDEVYRWFMGMYLDAYDWVMVPNIYGMSQYAKEEGFASKPYISAANYLKKMSTYSSGDWADIWTALYWRFIAKHQTYFTKQPRLSMMPRLLQQMKTTTRDAHMRRAEAYLASIRA